MYSSSKKAFDSFAGVRVGTGLGDCAANRRPTATRRRVPVVDVDAPSENRAALAARGCDEPGLAAVAGVVAGAAAVAGERCLVAMFAPRPLLTASDRVCQTTV